jgi:hypothetical protein
MKPNFKSYYRKIVLEILPIEACTSVVSALPVRPVQKANREYLVLQDHKVFKAIQVYLDHKAKPDHKVRKDQKVKPGHKASKEKPETEIQ